MLKSISKVFVYSVLFVLLLLSLLGIYGWVERVSLMEEVLARALGVPVEMKSLEVTSSGFKAQSVIVSNPEGMKRPVALEVNELSLKLNYLNLLNDPIEVDDVILDDVKLFVEMRGVGGGKTNWTQILYNLDPNAGVGENNGKDSGNKRRIIIKNLQIRNMRFEVQHPVLGKSNTRIKNIHLSDVGKEGRLSSKQSMHFIIRSMIGYVMKIPKFHKVLKNVVKLPKNIFKEIFFPGKDPNVELDDAEEEEADSTPEESSIKPGLIETMEKADKFMKSFKPFEENVEK